MQKLLAFIVTKRHWLLFFMCEILSFILIYKNNAYQQTRMLSSANAVVGVISAATHSAFSFFYLRTVNRELLERNSQLEMEVVRLEELLRNRATDSTSFQQIVSDINDLASVYKYIPAGVVNNSVAYMTNYITINKGYKDGVRPDMGVVSSHGITGIIKTVDARYSVAISLLNVKWKVSCKVKGAQYFGGLSWKGGDVRYAYLEELPTHTIFHIGDTVVTSGYSSVFPPGIIVGTVESYEKQRNDNFYSLKVRLATDFRALNTVCIIDNSMQTEQQAIEQEAIKND